MVRTVINDPEVGVAISFVHAGKLFSIISATIRKIIDRSSHVMCAYSCEDGRDHKLAHLSWCINL